MLSGETEAIHGLNSTIGVELDRNNKFLNYLIFSCGMLRGDEGRLHLVESIDQIPWREDLNPDRVADIGRQIAPAHLLSMDESAALIDGFILYAGRLFKARFKVHASGIVEMLDNKLLIEEVVARLETFDGLVRMLSTDPPNVPSPIGDQGDSSSVDRAE